MPKLWDQLTKRAAPTLSLDDWVQFFTFQGLQYPFVPSQTFTGERTEEPGGDFRGLIEGVYRRNGVVFACMMVRRMLFSEARFQFRQIRGGRPGDLFGTADLEPLERPWLNGTTGKLLSVMLTDADLAGNAYVLRQRNELRRLRPDWVTIISGSKTLPSDPESIDDFELLGYVYQPGGPASGSEPVALAPEQVAHFAPVPDPSARFRGMSWLTPVLPEIVGDVAAMNHKTKFFDNAATPNLVVTFDPAIDQPSVAKWVEAFKAGHEGAANAYKTLFLGGGADAKTVGANLKEIEFTTVQAHGENRIANAAGVPGMIVGLSEGTTHATFSNYGQAMRRFTDLTMRPLWREAAGSLASILTVPPQSELWYDDRDIPALQEDLKDLADVQMVQAQTIKFHVEAGYTPESAKDAVLADDLGRLVHTGMTSVQLLPPGKQKQNGSAPAGQVPAGG